MMGELRQARLLLPGSRVSLLFPCVSPLFPELNGVMMGDGLGEIGRNARVRLLPGCCHCFRWGYRWERVFARVLLRFPMFVEWNMCLHDVSRALPRVLPAD